MLGKSYIGYIGYRINSYLGLVFIIAVPPSQRKTVLSLPYLDFQRCLAVLRPSAPLLNVLPRALN